LAEITERYELQKVVEYEVAELGTIRAEVLLSTIYGELPGPFYVVHWHRLNDQTGAWMPVDLPWVHAETAEGAIQQAEGWLRRRG
jgi:hypothetical protein